MANRMFGDAVGDEATTVPKGAGQQHVYEILKARILSLDFEPGAPLEEARLAKQLGVSRTPIREALIRLGSEKLVVLFSNRGAVVAPLDLTGLRHYFEALGIAQRAVTRMAAERCDGEQIDQIRRQMETFEVAVARRDSDAMIEANRDFHLSIATAADNSFMFDMCASLYNQGLRVSRMAVTYDFDRDNKLSDHLDLIIEQHRAFVSLITTRDADAAEALAGDHAELAQRRVIDAMMLANKK